MRTLSTILLIAAVGSCTSQQQGQKPETGSTAAETVNPKDIVYPDPWKETFRQNKVTWSVSTQYEVKAGQADAAAIKDSVLYDENGKQIMQVNSFYSKKTKYDDKGFTQVMLIENGGNGMKYLFTYHLDEKNKQIAQRAFELKDKNWETPANLVDTVRGFLPTYLIYDENGRIVKEKSPDANTTYIYNAEGQISQIIDSSMHTMQRQKRPMIFNMAYQPSGVMNTYTDYLGTQLNERASLRENGLIDTMRMFNADGSLAAYRTFKYYFRK